MAGLGDVIVRNNEYRTCIVDNKKALFHRWIDIAYTTGAELTIRRESSRTEKIYSRNNRI